MSKETVREEIAKYNYKTFALQLRIYKEWEEQPQIIRDAWLVDGDQILSLKAGKYTLKELVEMAESGKIAVLAEDQTIDIPDSVFFSEEAKRCGFTKRSFLEAGWRKIEL